MTAIVSVVDTRIRPLDTRHGRQTILHRRMRQLEPGRPGPAPVSFNRPPSALASAKIQLRTEPAGSGRALR